MKFELFIAKKIVFAKNSKNNSKGNIRPIMVISISGIALSVAIMLISISIVRGFQSEIREKVIGFGTHLRISSLNYEKSNVFNPIEIEQDFYPSLKNLEEIKNIQIFALKEGVIKTDENIYGVIAKGISDDFDAHFFNKNMVAGDFLKVSSDSLSKSVIISKYISEKNKLQLGDNLLVYFFKNGQSRPRKFRITGIYETGLEKFDKNQIVIDIKHIQKLNDWEANQVAGFEVLLNNYKDLFKIDAIMDKYIGYNFRTEKITETNQEIFGWLELQDINVIVILSLMVLVGSVCMASGLLVLILDKTPMIGMLKAMGASNWSVRKIFVYNASYLIAIGLFWGNFFGLGLSLIQHYGKLITLDKASYYLEYVPIKLELFNILVINLGTFFLCSALMIIPSSVISRIKPIAAIKFN